MSGWLPPGCTDKDIDDAAPQDEPEDDIPEDVVTTYDPPPIPLRVFDWRATRDEYEPGLPIGFGRTERDAVLDLLTIERETRDKR